MSKWDEIPVLTLEMTPEALLLRRLLLWWPLVSFLSPIVLVQCFFPLNIFVADASIKKELLPWE